MRISPKARLLCQTATVALLLPGLAAAQTADIPLDPIVVEGQSGTGPVGGIANPATLTGSKTATPLTEIPQSVSVIGAEEIQTGNLRKLDAALGYTAGVQAAPFGYDSDTNWQYIRGFEATQSQDGLTHYAYGFGGFYVDPYQVERIEVLKGASSVLYGGAAGGGLVNYVSKFPTGTPKREVEFGFDEDGRVWTGVDVEDSLASGDLYRFVGKIERVDGNGAFDPGFHGVIAPSVKLNYGATDWTLGLSYTRIDEDHVGGSWLPYIGTVERAPYGYIDREFNTSDPDHDWYKRDQVLLSSVVEHDFGNGWQMTNNTRLGWSDIDESAPYASGYGFGPTFATQYQPTPQDPDFNLSRVFFQHQTETTTFLNDARVERTLTAGAVEHRLMFGVDFRYFHMDQVQASASSPTAPTLSITDPVYGIPMPDPIAYIDQDITLRQLGIYGQDQIRWGDGWIATLNARYDFTDISSGENVAPNAGSRLPVDRDDKRFTGRIGLAKELSNGMTPYASISTYFNPQVVNDANGNDIAPETGRQIEAGLKWQPADHTLFTAAVFDLRRENISQSAFVAGIGNVYSQIGEVRSRGVELEAKSEVAEGLVLSGALTKMDIEVLDDLNTGLIGNTPYRTIENLISVRASYDVAAVPGLNVNLGVRYLGSSWADNENTRKVPSQTLVDAGASYDFGRGWNANFAVSNLTDETYVSSCQGVMNCYYGDGRKASLAIRKSF